MSRTRILLVELPRLLSGVVRGIVSQHSGLEIVGEAASNKLLDSVAAMTPDVIVLGTTAGERAPPLATLRALHPALRVVTLDRDGRCATALEPNAAPRTVTEVSPSTLLEMLRGSMR